MNTNQREVIKWWHSGRDFQMGVMLLSKVSKRKNNVMVQTLMKPGKEKLKKFHGKLHYELTKAVGLNWKKMPPLPPSMKDTSDVISHIDIPPKPVKKIETSSNGGNLRKPDTRPVEKQRIPLVSQKPLSDYPKIIRRLKYEYSNLYTNRSLHHKKMRNIPDKNTPANKNARAILLQKIKEHSAQMDHLYHFIQLYEQKGTIPLEEEIWPKPKKEEDQLPDVPQELKKRKKNLQSANTKDRNKLLFQKNSRGKTENPMPDGPKRKKIELRIKERIRKIETIELKLLDIEN